MVPNPTLSLDAVWANLREYYDTSFLEGLMRTPDCHVYLYGGTVRDMLLGKPWKDIDCRVVCNKPKEERNKIVEDVLLRYGEPLQVLFFTDGELKVYRMKIPGKKTMVVDFQIADSVELTPGDFTPSCIFYDLHSGELVEQVPHCFEDFAQRVIRLAAGNHVLTKEPHLLLRALKPMCQTGFTLHPEFEAAMHENKELVQTHVRNVLLYIQENGKNSFAEAMLNNFFAALKTDPVRYVSLLHEYGLFEQLCRALLFVCGNQNVAIEMVPNQSARYGGNHSFEQKISMLLSDIARAISNSPEQCFESLKKAFALDTDRSDGNEFAIKSADIQYVN